MGNTRWYSMAGHLNATFSAEQITISNYELVYAIGNVTLGEFSTREEAEQAQSQLPSQQRRLSFIRKVDTHSYDGTAYAQSPVVIQPLPIFTQAGTLLATRGYWDTAASASPSPGISVANFAMGMLFLPTGSVYDVGEDADMTPTYSLKDPSQFPSLLIDDAGYHVYESFARLSGGSLNQDPPFYSKSKRRFPANSALVVLVECDFASVDGIGPQSISLTFGIRFRCLIQF